MGVRSFSEPRAALTTFGTPIPSELIEYTTKAVPGVDPLGVKPRNGLKVPLVALATERRPLGFAISLC